MSGTTFSGKILRVDLTTGRMEESIVDTATARKYIGGVGLAAKMLWSETKANTGPLSPENPLMFLTGPLTGTTMPSSSRYIVAGISPLTGIFGEAHSGGNWADELRHSGFMGIVITGEAEQPVYLWVNNGKAEIRDARHLWGIDTYEVDALLKKETDPNASSACIGQAGEKLVRIACIINDGRMGRAAARTGLGALMGAKKLKAVVARGTLPIAYYDENKFKESLKAVYAKAPVEKSEDVIEREINLLRTLMTLGAMPVRNFRDGTLDALLPVADALKKTKPLYCRHCPYPDMESHCDATGRHMLWESIGPLGGNLLITDPGALQEAYTLCNKYGMDTESAGVCIGFGMECYEKGLISRKDTGGLELTWGNAPAMLEMLKQIGERQGVGALLGQGVKKAAEDLGGLAGEYAMHVKGLELPAHDPRAGMTLAIGYATASAGATHTEAIMGLRIEDYTGAVAEGAHFPDFSELGYPTLLNRFTPEGKAVVVAKAQNLGCMHDSLSICLMLSLHQGLMPSSFIGPLNAATGWDMDLNDFMLTGERIFNLKRMINVRRGISRKDDNLPARILSHKRGSGKAADSLPYLGKMLNEYYAYRGWSEEGIPTREKLVQLGLTECL